MIRILKCVRPNHDWGEGGEGRVATWLVLFGLIAILSPDFIAGLKDVSVTIPQAVRRGSNALFICNYDMENDTLYSVKWYKGRREFYRYTPKENPAMKTFPTAAGINVERNLSNQSHVVLLAVPLSISGKFTCEISVEAPSFLTAMMSGEMEVVELPEQRPVVTGIHSRYRIGDLVDGNCSIKFSKPAANLTWTINGVVLPLHHIKMHQVEKYPEHNLESAMSAINFMVTTQYFIKGQMKLKCTATIFDIYKEEVEKFIEEDRPRIMASGRSYDMSAYPYEQQQQQSSGDGMEDHNESYLTYYSAADVSSSAMSSPRALGFVNNCKWFSPSPSSSITRYVKGIKKQIENATEMCVCVTAVVLKYYASYWKGNGAFLSVVARVIVWTGFVMTTLAVILFLYHQKKYQLILNDFLSTRPVQISTVDFYNNYNEIDTNLTLSVGLQQHQQEEEEREEQHQHCHEHDLVVVSIRKKATYHFGLSRILKQQLLWTSVGIQKSNTLRHFSEITVDQKTLHHPSYDKMIGENSC